MSGKRKLHYAWKILVVCCLLQGATLGLIQNSRGLFFAPVSESLGCTITEFTAQQMVFSIFNIAALPFADKVLRRKQIRWILCGVMTVFAGATALMGTFQTVYQWYAAAAVQGISGAFLIMIPASILINQWFMQRRGFALGVSAAAAGMAGIAVNMFMADFVTVHWRVGYFVIGGLAFAAAVPAMAVVVRFSPKEKNTEAYGGQKADEKDVEKQNIRKSVRGRRGLLFFIAVITAAASSCLQHFPNYAVTVGRAASAGAVMTSLAMVGNTLGKFFMGLSSDCLGSVKTAFGSLLAIGASFGMLMLGKGTAALYPAALINGLALAFSSVQIPLLFLEFYDEESYGKILPIVMIFTNLASSLGTIGISALYDWSGSYKIVFRAFFLMILFAVVLLALVGNKKQYVH